MFVIGIYVSFSFEDKGRSCVQVAQSDLYAASFLSVDLPIQDREFTASRK